MIRSNFSTSGLPIGEDNVNMTYAYGLGDFFSVMFEDTSVPNLLLESDTLVASEVYSRFLQLTSGMSLEDVQVTLGSQIKLVLLNSADLVEGTPSTYRLPSNIPSARYVANRPLLPTELLESKVDFDISQEEDGTCYIRFASRLDNGGSFSGQDYAFSSRLLQDGTTQYALWFVDAHIDERMISSCFGNLIGVDSSNSSEEFANFVYGLYYVYTQGPTLTVLRRGLNLVIGIPLARMQETVIDIRMYLQTDQYIVITDQNQYLIPYGLPPSVAIGDTLQVGQELAQWVEVKDYTSDGDWWLNLYIPSTLIPEPPAGDNSRYAVQGGQVDYIMRTYLKTHTFLVRVNVTTFKNNQNFTQLFSIINRSKPAYTQPVYVWSVSNEETITLSEAETLIDIKHRVDYDIGASYEHMKRSSELPLLRGTARFIRFNGPAMASSLVGESAFLNSSNNNIQTLDVSGYSNPRAAVGGNSWEEIDWISTLANRSSDTWRGRRDTVGYRRGDLITASSPVRPGYSWSGTDVVHQTTPLHQILDEVPENSRVVPLTVMSYKELDQKLEVFGQTRPASSRFTIRAYDRTRAINTHAILYPVLERAAGSSWPTQYTPTPLEVVKFFGVRKYSLAEEDSVTEVFDNTPPSMGRDMCKSMFYQGGLDVSYASEGDLVLFCQINCDLVSVYLVTQDAQSSLPAFLPAEDPIESASFSTLGVPTRGMAVHESPAYFRRGSLTFLQEDTLETLEDPSTQLASYLLSEGVSETAKVIPLTVIGQEEAIDKARFWNSTLEPTSKYSFLPHPYSYRVMAEKVLKKSQTFVAISPSLNTMYQDWQALTPVTGMEQPVGLMVDRYGFGASAYQEKADRRPVVRARYNLLSYTSFEGTVPSEDSLQTGTAPNGWSILSSAPGAYISGFSKGSIRLESYNAYIVLEQSVQVPATTSTRFHLNVALNPDSALLKELLEVQAAGATVTYYVNSQPVDPLSYAPEKDTSVSVVVKNDSLSTLSVNLRFGVGVSSSKTSTGVTLSATFRQPDYRYVLGQTGLPEYQRVGSPVAGSSLYPGIADYETEGFPPYLSFDGVNDSLTITADSYLNSDKVTVFASVLRPSRTSYGTPLEIWSNSNQANTGRVLQENTGGILTEDTLSSLAQESTVRFSLSWPDPNAGLLLQENFGKLLTEDGLSALLLEKTVNIGLASGADMVAILEGLYGELLSYRLDNTSTPVYGTYSAVIDTANTTPTQEVKLYFNGDTAATTITSPGPVDPFLFTDTQVIIGSNGGSESFFQGNIFGIVVASSALTVDERQTVEEWVSKELTSYAYKENSYLYHYPDFFRRDGGIPLIPQAPLGNIYEFFPERHTVDMDWGYDRVLLHRIDRETIGLYLVSDRDEGGPTDYWTISYSGVPHLTRVSSGQPEQEGLVVVPPFIELASLNYDYLSRAVDSASINSLLATPGSVFLYSDLLNTNAIVTRGGMTLSQALSLQ